MNNNDMIEIVKVVDKNPKQTLLKKSPEDRVYLICLAGSEYAWDIVTGRTEAYTTIKDYIINTLVDFEKSFILVETAKLNDRKSFVAFMKYAEQFYDDSFDIEDYIKGDWSEEEYKKQNEVDNQLVMFDNDKLDMQSFMNGDIHSSSLGNDE